MDGVDRRDMSHQLIIQKRIFDLEYDYTFFYIWNLNIDILSFNLIL